MEARRPTAPPVLNVVGFMAGGFAFAVEARQIRAMLPAGEGGAVMVEDLLGLPPHRPGPRYRLERAAGGPGVEVSGPVGFLAFPAGTIFPLPPLVAARLGLAGVKALALLPSGPALIIDLDEVSP